MTHAIDNINMETVKQNIKWLNDESGFTTYQRAQIIILMKERCIKADKYFESELYFEEQFKLVEDGVIWSENFTNGEHELTFKPKSDPTSYFGLRTANFRPNNY